MTANSLKIKIKEWKDYVQKTALFESVHHYITFKTDHYLDEDFHQSRALLANFLAIDWLYAVITDSQLQNCKIAHILVKVKNIP